MRNRIVITACVWLCSAAFLSQPELCYSAEKKKHTQKAAGTVKPAKKKPAAAPVAAPAEQPIALAPGAETDFTKKPTDITSNSLTLYSNERRFIYEGGVKVVQGDMTLISSTLEGTYNEQNKIQTMTALKDVVITKGPTLKATGQRAVYDANQNTVVLTENPQLEQEGSRLNADIVRVYLKENRSTAEGNVKVTLINTGDAKLVP